MARFIKKAAPLVAFFGIFAVGWEATSRIYEVHTLMCLDIRPCDEAAGEIMILRVIVGLCAAAVLASFAFFYDVLERSN